MEAIFNRRWVLKMLVERVDIFENATLAANDKIIDGDDVLAVFRQANTANVLSLQISNYEQRQRDDVLDGSECQIWLREGEQPSLH